MDNVSKSLIIAGVVLIGCGLLWYFTDGKIPLGRLPGDIKIESENSKFYFPITTCLLISAVFSLIAYISKKF